MGTGTALGYLHRAQGQQMRAGMALGYLHMELRGLYPVQGTPKQGEEGALPSAGAAAEAADEDRGRHLGTCTGRREGKEAGTGASIQRAEGEQRCTDATAQGAEEVAGTDATAQEAGGAISGAGADAGAASALRGAGKRPASALSEDEESGQGGEGTVLSSTRHCT